MINKEKYDEACYLSAGSIPNPNAEPLVIEVGRSYTSDDFNFENTEWYDSIADEIEGEGMNKVDLPNGIYSVFAFHHIDQKEAADKRIGFTDTEWTPHSEMQGWGYSKSSMEVEVVNGKVNADDLAWACQDAHARSGYWGDFFEGVEFDTDLNGFQVYIGS